MKSANSKSKLINSNLNNYENSSSFVDYANTKNIINNSISSDNNSNNSSSNSSSSSSPTSHKAQMNNKVLPYTTSISLTASSKQAIHLKQFDPLPEITVTPSYENAPIINEFIPLLIPQSASNSMLATSTNPNAGVASASNSSSFSPSSSSSVSIPTNSANEQISALVNSTSKKLNNNEQKFDETQIKSADIMIYLNLKETLNNLDFSVGFKKFIISHYREDPNNYYEQMRQFNYFREVWFYF